MEQSVPYLAGGYGGVQPLARPTVNAGSDWVENKAEVAASHHHSEKLVMLLQGS
jgi:hypothetical protein